MTRAENNAVNELCVEVEDLALRNELTLDFFNDRLQRAKAIGADDVDLLPMYRTAAGEGLIRLSDYFRVEGPVGRNVTPSR